MTSTSLMTHINIIIGSIKESEDNQYFQHQKALEAIQTELKMIQIKGIWIPVDIEIIPFSIGVNNFSLGATPAYELLNKTSWAKADRITYDGLFRLLGDPNENAELGGWVKTYLDSLSRSNTDRIKATTIKMLCRDIKHIFANKMHHKEGNDRYCLPRRIIYLSYLIDAVPAFNCKSGKDRTGMVDSEVKALAATIYKTHSERFSPQQSVKEHFTANVSKETLRAFHLDTPNFKIQRLNVGLTGNKVMCYQSNYFDSMFTQEQLGLVKGLLE